MVQAAILPSRNLDGFGKRRIGSEGPAAKADQFDFGHDVSVAVHLLLLLLLYSRYRSLKVLEP